MISYLLRRFSKQQALTVVLACLWLVYRGDGKLEQKKDADDKSTRAVDFLLLCRRLARANAGGGPSWGWKRPPPAPRRLQDQPARRAEQKCLWGKRRHFSASHLWVCGARWPRGNENQNSVLKAFCGGRKTLEPYLNNLKKTDKKKGWKSLKKPEKVWQKSYTTSQNWIMFQRG